MKDIFAPLLNQRSAILFVGIGNRLKSDDAVGIYICDNLLSTKGKQKLIVESGIEKYVGKINDLSPEILVLVDCTDFNKEPGYLNLFTVDKIQDNSLHTHTISLGRISEFFEMKTYILGIQPEFVGFGEEISQVVKDKADEVVAFINERL